MARNGLRNGEQSAFSIIDGDGAVTAMTLYGCRLGAGFFRCAAEAYSAQQIVIIAVAAAVVALALVWLVNWAAH
jgi:hypothetical protein